MTEKEKELLLSYFCNTDILLEDDIVELRNRIRFRRIGIEENVEMMLLLQRQQDFAEFSAAVLALLHLS